MLNQVTRALSALFRPIASGKTSEDRDPTGNAYENLQQGKKDKKKEEASPEPEPQAKEAAVVQIHPVAAPPASSQSGASPPSQEEELERRKKAIADSQAWVGLVTELEEQKAGLGEQAKASGAGAYEKANMGSSRAARAKKGVILDKKAA